MLTLEKFSGINNVVPQERLDTTDLTVATNVDIGLTGEQRHCIAVVAVEREMVGPDALAHVEDHGQVVRSIASGEGFRAGRQVPEFIETACVLGDVFVRQLVRHHEVHEGPALGLVRGVVKVKGFRAVGGGRNAQQQKDSVQAPDARQRAPRGLLAQGTAAPVNGQVNEGRQQQGPGGGGGGVR